MKKKDENKILIPRDHKLKSRRDFLSHGLIAGTSYTMAPSLFGFLKMNQAYGMDCGVGEVQALNKKTPMVIIDVGGGSNIAGTNVIVGGSGGQTDFLPNYRSVGLTDGLNPASDPNLVNSEMGLKFHARSQMLQGILDNTSAAVRAKVDGGIFCARSDNDTGNNPHNPLYWLNKAGAMGDLVQTAGTRDSQSGGKSRFPASSFDPTIAPIRITGSDDARQLATLGRVGDLFGQDKTQKILKTMERMSERRLQQFSQKTLPEQVKDVVTCGFDTSTFTGGRFSPDGLDSSRDTDVQAVYGNDANGRRASLVKLILDGNLGVGTIEIGGGDYHGRTKAQQETKDNEIGREIGRILNLANRKGTDVCIYLFTDGGVAAGNRNDVDNGKIRFSGDNSERAATMMLVYRHNADNKSDIIRTLGAGNSVDLAMRQVGFFDKSNIVASPNASVVSNNVENLAKAVVANYLALHNEEGRLAEIVGNNPFGNDLDKYLFFKS